MHSVERQPESIQVVEGVGLVLFKVETILPFRNLIFYWNFISLNHRLYFPCLFIKLDDNDLRTLFSFSFANQQLTFNFSRTN